ncbi:protein-tyrosine-phosphatase [Kineosphaera limosa]|uniref:Putative arsenate reductase n=1 Tax=Kineosphaera limosa NBRC 100340 TaxID=1184609 RepID=K6VJP7_9MICO|nr:putative arsenate reductase [Kineosphaera limosa]NYE01759.1 protein-tyrosine-phosphatase [Kineosphaera limosa]GAB96443.1 putative arsenate reductase [Kineosphaera limosa NBRC 100340]
MVYLETTELDQIIDQLSERYEGSFSRAEIAVVVADSHDQLGATSTSKTYLPVFVQRFAKERLGHLAEAKGLDPAGVHDILFICNGNAGRSQMAAAFATAQAQGRVRAWSAGINPMESVLPDVVEAMTEVGIDMDESYPKPVTGDATRAAEYIVAIGVPEDELPTTGRMVLTWDVPPVVGTSPEETRAARDDLRRRVHDLLEDVLG